MGFCLIVILFVDIVDIVDLVDLVDRFSDQVAPGFERADSRTGAQS